MELMNKDGKEEGKQPERKSHETQMREFASKLNGILSEGFSLPAVIQVLDSALFEMRFSLYMQQIEIAEKQKQMQKHIEIPNMKIPTNKTR